MLELSRWNDDAAVENCLSHKHTLSEFLDCVGTATLAERAHLQGKIHWPVPHPHPYAPAHQFRHDRFIAQGKADFLAPLSGGLRVDYFGEARLSNAFWKWTWHADKDERADCMALFVFEFFGEGNVALLIFVFGEGGTRLLIALDSPVGNGYLLVSWSWTRLCIVNTVYQST